MARQRRQQEDPAESQEPGNGAPPADEATAQLTVRGPVSQVEDTLRRREPIRPDSGEASDDAFIKALKNPKYQVVVKRIQPRVWRGQKINFEVYRESCPLDVRAIEEEVFSNHGGKRFRVAVQDQNGTDIAARILETDADPLPPLVTTDESDPFGGMTAGQAEKTPGEQTEETLQQSARITRAQLENERLKQEFEDLKAQRVGSKPNADLEGRIAALQKQLDDRIEGDRIASFQDQYEAKIADLNRKIELIGIKTVISDKPRGGESDGMITLLREQMKQSDQRFNMMMEQMRDQKLDAIQNQLTQIQNAPKKEGMGVLEAVRIAREVKDMFDDGGEEGGDDDEVTEENWWKPVLKEISKGLPKLFDIFAEKAKTEKITKEDMVQEVNRAAAAAAAETLTKLRANQVRSLPPPVHAPPAILPSPIPLAVQIAGSVAAPVQTAPEPAPAASQQPVSVELDPAKTTVLPSIQEPEPEPEEQISPELEIKLRVAKCLELLRREMKIRPRRWEWTLTWWEIMPEDLLGRAAASGTPVGMIGTFADVVKPEAVTTVQNEITADPKIDAWVARGVCELQDWLAKATADPNFDPGAEEDGPEE